MEEAYRKHGDVLSEHPVTDLQLYEDETDPVKKQMTETSGEV